MQFQKITLVGVGLLGGSLGLAIRQRHLSDVVFGFVRRAEAAAECERAGAVDHATCDLARAIEAADLVIKGLNEAIASKRVTYDFARLMEGATEIKCSEFGDNIIEHME